MSQQQLYSSITTMIKLLKTLEKMNEFSLHKDTIALCMSQIKVFKELENSGAATKIVTTGFDYNTGRRDTIKEFDISELACELAEIARVYRANK